MATNKISKERSAKVLDLLEQIDNVNEMIRFHQETTQERIMIIQYKHLKNKFLQDLKTALSAFEVEIEVTPVLAAA